MGWKFSFSRWGNQDLVAGVWKSLPEADASHLHQLFAGGGYQITLFEGMVQMKERKWMICTTYRKGKANSNMHVLLWWPGTSPPWLWEASLRLPLITVSQHVIVKEILCHARLEAAIYMVKQFFDGFHLLIQVMSLNKVKQMEVILSMANFLFYL